MSSNRLTIGFMAELRVPIAEEELDKFDGPLQINYEGTLAYIVTKGDFLENAYGINMSEISGVESKMLRDLAMHEKHPIKCGTTRFFFDIWYDGADSNHANITLKQFKEFSAC